MSVANETYAELVTTNAQLLAQRDELAEALDDCVRKLAAVIDGGSYKEGVLQATLDAARTISAKAKGEQP